MDISDFSGKLGKYKVIETEDKTKTLWSEYFDEACHSLSGAYKETLYNYIEGCQIAQQINCPLPLHVLDVGFGLGVGLSALMDELKNHPPKEIVTYTSMELDEELINWSIKNNFPHLTFKKTERFYQANEPFLITIYIGDGRLTLPKAFKLKELPEFTAIFQDAFSPKKNKSLWTVEWFNDLKMMSHPDVYLSTYSASITIRKSLLASGWQIENARGFGAKRTMTKARLTGETDALLIAELKKSAALELKDI